MKKLVMLMLVVLLALPAYSLDIKDLKFTGHYRLRGYNYQVDETNLTRFYKQRVWLGVGADVAENVYANVTLEMEHVWGKDNQMLAGSEPNAKMVYGYVTLSKLFDKEMSLTLGRQAYQLNKNNFLLWDSANGLDGMVLNYKTGDWDLDAIYLKVAESTNNDTGDINDKEFYGLVANYKGFDKQKIQGYVLLDRNANRDNESDLNQYIGLRAEGAIKAVEGLSYIAEYINNSGDNGANPDTDYKGSLYYLCAGYEVKDMNSLKFVLDYLVASGDNNSADNKDKSFNFSSFARNGGTVNLEGNFNFDNGMDAFRTKKGNYENIRALGFGLSFKPTDKWFLGTKYSIVKLDKTDATVSASKKLGNNFDIVTRYDLGKTYYVCAGYTMFDANNDYVGTNGKKTDVLAAEFRVNF